MAFLDVVKGLATAGIGFLLTFTPLAPLGKALIFYGLGTALGELLPPAHRNATFRANSVSTDNPIKVVIGEAIVGGAIADYRKQPGFGGKFLYGVVCLSHAGWDGTQFEDIEAIEEIFIDGKLAVPAGAVDLGPGGVLVTDSPIVSFFQDGFDYGKYLGGAAQTVPVTLNNNLPTAWPATSEGVGVAHLVFKLENKPEKFPGLPTITARVKGPKVFDPRDSLRKWTKNPALWIREALINPVWGKGRPITELDEQSFIDAADHCDELVSTPDGNKARYEVSGVWDTSVPIERNLEMLEVACMGEVVFQGGLYRLVQRKAQSPTGFVFDESVIARRGAVDWSMPGLARGGANSIIAAYIEPGVEQADGTWTQDTVNRVQWPQVGAANPYLAEDNDFDAPETIRLDFVRDRYRALQIASILLKEKREGDTFHFVAHEAAIENEVGDVAELDLDVIGNLAPLPFWIRRMEIGPEGLISVTGMRYNAAAYSLPSLTAIADPPDSDLPQLDDVGDPTGLSVSAVRTCVDGVTTGIQLVATWTNPTDAAHHATEVEYRDDDAGPGPWIDVPDQPAAATSVQFHVPDFDDQHTYRVRIRSRNPHGAVGTFVEATVDLSGVACTTDVNVGGAGQNHGTVSGAINISFLDGWIQIIEPNGDVDVTLIDTFAGSVMRPLQLLVLQNGGPWNITFAVENTGTILWSPDGVVPDLTQNTDADDSFSFSAIAQDLVYAQQMGRDYG